VNVSAEEILALPHSNSSAMFVEAVVAVSILYLVGSGKVSNIQAAARLAGVYVGRAAGVAGRIRLQADKALQSAASTNPELRASSAALQEKLMHLRTVSAETKNSVSWRSFLQTQMHGSGHHPTGSPYAARPSFAAASGVHNPANSAMSFAPIGASTMHPPASAAPFTNPPVSPGPMQTPGSTAAQWGSGASTVAGNARAEVFDSGSAVAHAPNSVEGSAIAEACVMREAEWRRHVQAQARAAMPPQRPHLR